MSRVFCTFFPQKVPIAVCDWCCLPLFGRLLTAVFARGVLCTFWPQKAPKTPRQMPAPTSSRLTFETGAYSRVCKQTVPFARAFSPHLFERLFCQAGVIRREKRHADGFGAFNFATLVFLLLARHSPQAVSARAACVGCHQKYKEIQQSKTALETPVLNQAESKPKPPAP